MWNLMNKLARKTRTDSDGEQDDGQWGWRVGLRGTEQKGKRAHRHGQAYGDYWQGYQGERGQNGHGKNTIKINFFKKTDIFTPFYRSQVTMISSRLPNCE